MTTKVEMGVQTRLEIGNFMINTKDGNARAPTPSKKRYQNTRLGLGKRSTYGREDERGTGGCIITQMRFTDLDPCQSGTTNKGCGNIYTEILSFHSSSIPILRPHTPTGPRGNIAQCAPSPPSPCILVRQRFLLLPVG